MEATAAMETALMTVGTFPSVPAVVVKVPTTTAEAFVEIAITVPIAATIIASTIEATTVVWTAPVMSVVAVIPGAGADEDTVHKIIRAVVAVRRAGVGIISVVAIGANRGRANDHWATDCHADTHLRIGAASRGEEQNSKQSCVFQVTHSVLESGLEIALGADAGRGSRKMLSGSGLQYVKHGGAGKVAA